MNTQVSSFDSKAFRRALGNFATGITVITATAPNGEKVGVTANSFNSVSLDPALILWSIDKRSGSFKVFEQASHFAVNILAADQIELSNHFARSSDDKFAGIEYGSGAGQAAILPDCAAVFECEKYEIIEGGDHWILIGKVVAFEDIGRAPLVYHQGSYSVVMPHQRPATSEDEAPGMKVLEGRLNNNFYYLMTQAVRAYQNDYQPLQLSTGLQTSEARMLIVLEQDRKLCIDDLLAEVNMPRQEIEHAAEILQRKGLVSLADNCYRITPKGMQQAETLWDLAAQEQEKVFSQFSDSELNAFRKVLTAIM
ncbi:p-hydroxyphenylacetate 3-hydroxylase reductase component [Marinobacterium lutimaris]|uniref:NADH-FMN oxidoreductase RutF, flavin reductase (DIM6/NTAB) family n=1 Tax=Marinobacterium lutimaris TaxID=568106 RepID=A0A1H6C1S0_9GAMM|nr:flavin reductase [Marinobacterium lutimaris]SEG66882.1 NADH-FMN oxidoreductase RutF, flavin reductase (DIM6/NTAB) family [Marinobacterium lutimaris]